MPWHLCICGHQHTCLFSSVDTASSTCAAIFVLFTCGSHISSFPATPGLLVLPHSPQCLVHVCTLFLQFWWDAAEYPFGSLHPQGLMSGKSHTDGVEVSPHEGNPWSTCEDFMCVLLCVPWPLLQEPRILTMSKRARGPGKSLMLQP